MVTFNYCCIQDECDVSGIIPIKKEREDQDRAEHCYGCDLPLKQVGEMTNFAIKGDIATRMLRNQAHFKNRAKKHAQSAEQQQLKKQRQDQEFASMGVHRKSKL